MTEQPSCTHCIRCSWIHGFWWRLWWDGHCARSQRPSSQDFAETMLVEVEYIGSRPVIGQA
jgi:hypothetical protein